MDRADKWVNKHKIFGIKVGTVNLSAVQFTPKIEENERSFSSS